MSELGRELRERRKEKEMSLERIQEVTKIRKRYLEAIENGEYNVLPGAFYARAFIKSYAEVLGLDPEEVLEKYRHELPQVESSMTDSIPPRSRSRRKERKNVRNARSGKWISNLIFYAFLLLIGFVIYLSVVYFSTPEAEAPLENEPGIDSEGHLSSNGDDNIDEQNDEKAEGEEQDLPTEPEVVEEEKDEPVLTKERTEGNRTYYTYQQSEQFEVRMETTQRVWFSLNDEITGKEIEQMELGQGESKSWDLTDYREIRYKFGNTPAVKLFINDEEVDLSGLSHVHHIIISYRPLGE